MTSGGGGGPRKARWAAAWERRRVDPQAALKEAVSLRELAEPCGDDETLGRARLLEGSCRWRLSDYTQALRALLAAGELLPPTAAAERAAQKLDLAVVKHYFGTNDEAMELALSALELYEAIGDEAGRANVLNNLGIVFWKRGDLDEALRVYQDSLEIRRRIGDRDGVAGCHNNIAKVLTDRGAYDLALRELAAAREVEPPRISRRLQLLRGCSDGKTKQVFAGGPRAGGPARERAGGGPRHGVGGHPLGSEENRLYAGALAVPAC